MYIRNDTLDALVTRFCHLMCKPYAHQIETTREEKVACLADALPPKWESFWTVLRLTEAYADIDINDFIQKWKGFDGWKPEIFVKSRHGNYEIPNLDDG